LIWGTNPRNGFFQENVFLHPEMAFRLTFPQGWATQNLPQAVVAGSPGQDAIIQLTLAPGDPESAASQFLAQQGVQAGPASRETINGLPAVVAQFAAQTQQGIIQGVASFISHGGRTYQLIGFAPNTRYAAMESAFVQTIRSFAPVKDPEV